MPIWRQRYDGPGLLQMNAVYDWINATWLHNFMVQSTVAFTAAETLHFMGLTVLFGALMVLDLRGLGFFAKIPLLTAHKLAPVAIGAFLVNLLTGVAFISSDPIHYFEDLSFKIKMFAILVAGLNAVIYELLVFQPLKNGRSDVENGSIIRITSAASLFLWAIVLIFGRLIPYV